MTIRQNLDKLFRKYLLKKAERNEDNQIFCPLNKRWYDEKYMDVCHYFSRENIGTRYSEENCILCSSSSNRNDEEHLLKFRNYLGDELVAHLNEIKTNKLSMNDLKELENKFK